MKNFPTNVCGKRNFLYIPFLIELYDSDILEMFEIKT